MANRRTGAGVRLRATQSPVVVITLVVLLVTYLVTGFATNFIPGGAGVVDALLLTAPDVMAGQVWRLLTYGLLHSLLSPMHLLFNGLMLWFFGRDIEARLGTWRFLLFLAASVFVGGCFVVGAWLLHVGVGAAVGFSAACEACIVAWALFNRNAQVMLFFAVPMRGIHMLALAILTWMLDAVSASQTSAAAHLGGIVTGLVTWLLIARRNRLRLLWDELLVKLHVRRGPRLTVVPKPDKWVN